ncbi:MAG: response regulator transcription factor [Phycisphaerales bacterium]|nr:response regulator transcription factor [Phycisphaerales bacterium]
MAATRVTVVEDDDAIREAIVATLAKSGYEVDACADGESGLRTARQPGCSLVLLDLMLPGMQGIDVLKELRKTHPTLPVIILTARGTEDDRVEGLRCGADDYVVKPFSTRELVARVEAVLRRSPERPSPVQKLRMGHGVIDLDRREIVSDGAAPQSLSETECQILAHLASNPGRAITRDELLTRIWGLSGGVETRTVDMHVARLRSKLTGACGEEAADGIATVRGRGYMLGANVQRVEPT